MPDSGGTFDWVDAEFPEEPAPTDIQGQLGNALDGIVEGNQAFSEGFAQRVVGRTITHATAEVWSSHGNWAFELTLDDGTFIEAQWAACKGDISGLVEMAGGSPAGEFGNEEFYD